MQFWKDDLEVNNTGCFFIGLSLFPSTRTGWLQLRKTRHLVSASTGLAAHTRDKFTHMQAQHIHIHIFTLSYR